MIVDGSLRSYPRLLFSNPTGISEKYDRLSERFDLHRFEKVVNLLDILLGALFGDGALDDGVAISNEIGSPVIVGGIKVEGMFSLDVPNDGNGRSSDDGHDCACEKREREGKVFGCPGGG